MVRSSKSFFAVILVNVFRSTNELRIFCASSFSAGDKISVLNSADKNWWEVRMTYFSFD